jgi:metal-dependent amidase/aminoacylase/carboxypeptidase family protein
MAQCMLDEGLCRHDADHHQRQGRLCKRAILRRRLRNRHGFACEIVTAFWTMITRSVNVYDPPVVTVGRITAGTTNNVIPETAHIEGTIRAVSGQTRAHVHDGIKRVAENIAAAHGWDGNVEIIYGYPVTTNDDKFAEFILDWAREVAGPNSVIRPPNPVMGAEDFSYALNELPGALAFLGGTPHHKNLATAAPNHSNRVYFEESARHPGGSMYTAAALRKLAPTQ